MPPLFRKIYNCYNDWKLVLKLNIEKKGDNIMTVVVDNEGWVIEIKNNEE